MTQRLHQRGDRLRLAVAEAVVVVGGLRREPDGVEGDEAGSRSSPVSARLPSIATDPSPTRHRP